MVPDGTAAALDSSRSPRLDAAPHEAMPNLPRARRPRRFALPAHDDHRAVDTIDALLGPRNRADADIHEAERGSGRPGADSTFGGLDPRLAFLDAVHREDDRVRRYRRPAAVAVLAIAGPNGTPVSPAHLDRGSWRLIDAATRVVRSTDRVARVGPDRLQLLMPETRLRSAERVVERIRAHWEERIAHDELPLRLVTAIAAPPPSEGIASGLGIADQAVTEQLGA
jgi:hypothetical protein